MDPPSPHWPADNAQCRTIAGLKFRCLGGPGSFMAINSPAIAHDNLSNLWFFKYMRENMDSWLKFANTRLNLDLDEQDIVFVSRTIKTTQWAMGVSPGEEYSGDLEEQCIFKQPGSESPGDGGPRFSGGLR